jgi:hypothetical protein
MSDDPNMMLWSLAAKQHLLNIYAGAGPGRGFEAAQRMTREIGDVVCEMHGQEKAAVLVYGVADSLATGSGLPKPPTLPAVVAPDVPRRSRFNWMYAGLIFVGTTIGAVASEILRYLASP